MTEAEIIDSAVYSTSKYVEKIFENTSKRGGKTMRTWCHSDYYNGFIAGADMNALKWIPVGERMPPPQYEDSHFSIDCLLFISCKRSGDYIRVGYYGVGWNISDGSPLHSSSVTHWMPLPPQPEL